MRLSKASHQKSQVTLEIVATSTGLRNGKTLLLNPGEFVSDIAREKNNAKNIRQQGFAGRHRPNY
jgi:hypothetical protein